MNKRTKKKELDFFPLFEKFIKDSERGRRVQPNGKRISPRSVKNYGYALKLLKTFAGEKGFTLRIKPERSLTKREMEREKNYWKKFYKAFTDFLYNDCGYYDNYIGSTIKIIKTFFNYLNKDLAMSVGQFHKQFYVRKEEIAIFPLMPEELNFLIYNEALEKSLSKRMREVKDVFVFGCTVALRVSDLLSLKPSAVREANGRTYLTVRAIKSGTTSVVTLPDYAVHILQKYKRRRSTLLPPFNKTNLNLYIKVLLEKAGFTQPVMVHREKRGKALEQKNGQKGLRFCDVATTHTMRRTAITTMLSLGMPEGVVRKISGHAPSSKEFFRYVNWSQMYMEQESEKMFQRLKEKRPLVA